MEKEKIKDPVMFDLILLSLTEYEYPLFIESIRRILFLKPWIESYGNILQFTSGVVASNYTIESKVPGKDWICLLLIMYFGDKFGTFKPLYKDHLEHFEKQFDIEAFFEHIRNKILKNETSYQELLDKTSKESRDKIPKFERK
jgi:hypothetical protein